MTCKRTVHENQIEKIILIFLKSLGLESRQSTQTPYETNSELNVTMESKCHSEVTALYTNMFPPNFTTKEGGNNKKSKNRKQHLIKCKRILWTLILHILQTCKDLSSDVGKYVYQYHLKIRLTLKTTN